MRTLADYKGFAMIADSAAATAITETCKQEYRKAARYARRKVEQIERKVLK